MEKLLIKNMVCSRCVMAVENLFSEMGIKTIDVQLGQVKLEEPLTAEEKQMLETALKRIGFEIISDKRTEQIEKIKAIIIDLIQNKNNQALQNLSALLSRQLGQDYSNLSNLFSAVEGITIEKFFIAQKIEKVKEWLIYDELTLSEIAFRLNYSSVAYLSNQFKRVTGLSPSQFKNLREKPRIALDQI